MVSAAMMTMTSARRGEASVLVCFGVAALSGGRGSSGFPLIAEAVNLSQAGKKC